MALGVNIVSVLIVGLGIYFVLKYFHVFDNAVGEVLGLGSRVGVEAVKLGGKGAALAYQAAKKIDLSIPLEKKQLDVFESEERAESKILAAAISEYDEAQKLLEKIIRSKNASRSEIEWLHNYFLEFREAVEERLNSSQSELESVESLLIQCKEERVALDPSQVDPRLKEEMNALIGVMDKKIYLLLNLKDAFTLFGNSMKGIKNSFKDILKNFEKDVGFESIEKIKKMHTDLAKPFVESYKMVEKMIQLDTQIKTQDDLAQALTKRIENDIPPLAAA